MTVFEVVALIAAFCGFAMVLGGIWLMAKGVITLAATPKTDALTIEWKKQFRMNTQVPGLAFFMVGLLFVWVALRSLHPADIVPIEFEGTIKGVEEPVSILVRPHAWELPSTTSGEITGKIYPDLSVLVLVVNAPGYQPYSKLIKLKADGPRLAQLGTLELHRNVRESDLSKSITDLPFNAPAPAKSENAAFGVAQ